MSSATRVAVIALFALTLPATPSLAQAPGYVRVKFVKAGVMTFIVSHHGTVFQKDLGPDTEKIAEAMTSFNPDKTWTKVDTNEGK